MKTCAECDFYVPHKLGDECLYWMQYVHVRGTNRACDMFIPKK